MKKIKLLAYIIYVLINIGIIVLLSYIPVIGCLLAEVAKTVFIINNILYFIRIINLSITFKRRKRLWKI